MTAMKWIGTRPKAICAGHKKYLVLQPWQTAKRIAFRFETVWCVFDGESIVLEDWIEGTAQHKKYPVAIVHNQYGTLIGSADPYQTGLDYNDMALSFRNALDERNMAKA